MDADLLQRLTTALESLTINHRTTESRAVALMKEIAYIKEFDGSRNHLTQFINVVSNHLEGVSGQARKDLWQLIYNSKIVGRAKELLLHNNPESWEQARDLLKQHFRPVINYKEITRKITSLRVSSIFDLNNKIEGIIQDINSFSTYETNPCQTKDSLYSLLTCQIKQIVSGNLSRDIRNEFNIHKIKGILYSYVGYDYPNIDKDFLIGYRKEKPKYNTFPKQINSPPIEKFFSPNNIKPNHFNNNQRANSHQSRNYNNSHFNNRPNSGQNRLPNFNPSGQIRNAYQRPEAMDIDHLTHRDPPQITQNEEVHNIDPEFFLN